MVGDRDVLFLKRQCQGESLDIGWSGRADRETISRSGVPCVNVERLVCETSGGGRVYIRLFKLK